MRNKAAYKQQSASAHSQEEGATEAADIVKALNYSNPAAATTTSKPPTTMTTGQLNGRLRVATLGLLLIAQPLLGLCISYADAEHRPSTTHPISAATTLQSDSPRQLDSALSQASSALESGDSSQRGDNYHFTEQTRPSNRAAVDSPDNGANQRDGVTPPRAAADTTTNEDADEPDSTGSSIADFIDNNYLATGLLDAHISQSPDLMIVRGPADDTTSGNELTDPWNSLLPISTKHHTGSPKSRRHVGVPREPPTADWWTKLSATKTSSPTKQQQQHKNGLVTPQGGGAKGDDDGDHNSRGNTPPVVRQQSAAAAVGSKSKGARKAAKPRDRDQVAAAKQPAREYKEQPLSQNAILTVKNQLAAIRSKHKALVTKSMRQLQQLDQKLIDSYRMCFKKKMPLYAGMLYRTRDFVANMAKEVKHERKVLEAMTKQVQGVLRQKMENRTLVREYDQLVATSTETSASWQQKQSVVKTVSTSTKVVVSTTLPRSKKDSISQLAEAHEEAEQQQLADNVATTKKVWHSSSGRKQGDSSAVTSSSSAKGPTSSGSSIKSSRHLDGRAREDEFTTDVRPKTPSGKYTVSINEVNLRKELSRSQALIDRIDSSSHDLSAVVDDIVYLFKLTTDKKGSMTGGKNSHKSQQQQRHSVPDATNDSSSSLSSILSMTPSQKRAKKTPKSPIRVFFEKYGRLSMDNFETPSRSNSTGTTNVSNSETSSYSSTNLPEIRPLFEPSSLVYEDPDENDLGFEYATAYGGE